MHRASMFRFDGPYVHAYTYNMLRRVRFALLLELPLVGAARAAHACANQAQAQLNRLDNNDTNTSSRWLVSNPV